MAASLVVDLLLKSGAFIADLKRVESSLSKFGNSALKAAHTVSVAFVGAVTATSALVKSAINVADTTGKMAQKIGISTDALSALTYAAKLSDLTQEDLGAGMIKLTKSMSDAAGGTGDAAKAFKAMGINVKNSDGTLKDSGKMMSELATKFAGYRDGAEKTALALAIFGKAGAAMIPLLNGSAAGLKDAADEAERLGLIIGTDLAQKAQDFNDRLTMMESAAQGLALRLASKLMPTLTDVSTSMVNLSRDAAFVTAAGAAVDTTFKVLILTFQTVAVLGANVGYVFRAIKREITTLVAQASALGVSFSDMAKGPAGIAAAMVKAGVTGEGSLKRFNEIHQRDVKEAEESLKRLQEFEKGIIGLGQPVEQKYDPSRTGGPPPKTPKKPPAPGLPDSSAANRENDQAIAYLDNLQKQIEKTKELTAVEQVAADVAAKRIKFTTAQRTKADELAKTIDDYKEESRRLGELSIAQEAVIAGRLNMADAAQNEAVSLVDSNDALKMEIAAIGRDEEGLLALEQAQIANVIATKEATLAVLESAGVTTKESDAIRGQIDALKERIGLLSGMFTGTEAAKELQRISDLSKQASQTIYDALGGGLEQGLTGTFDGILKSWGDMLLQMVQKAIAADVLSALTGGASGKGGNTSAIWGGLSKVFGSLFGSSQFTGAPGKTSVDWGMVPEAATGMDYVPKDMLIKVHEGERITPKAFNPVAGNGGAVNVQVINNGAPATATTTRERTPDGRELIKIMMTEIKKDIGAGGPVSKSMQGQFGLTRANPRRG